MTRRIFQEEKLMQEDLPKFPEERDIPVSTRQLSRAQEKKHYIQQEPEDISVTLSSESSLKTRNRQRQITQSDTFFLHVHRIIEILGTEDICCYYNILCPPERVEFNN